MWLAITLLGAIGGLKMWWTPLCVIDRFPKKLDEKGGGGYEYPGANH